MENERRCEVIFDMLKKCFWGKPSSNNEQTVKVSSGILEIARSVPPHCLDGFVLHDDTELLRQIAVEKDSVAWQLECSCGGKKFQVHGYESGTREKDFIADPVSVTCPACGRIISVFDGQKDGYNGMLDQEDGVSRTVSLNTAKTHTLAGCFHLMVVCQYALDDEEVEAEGFNADYFTNIIGYGMRDGESVKAMFGRETA